MSLWSEYEVDFTHCYENQNHETFTNVIDHILVLKRSKSDCSQDGVLHHPENLSDYEPIYPVVDITNENTFESNEDVKKETTPKFDWKNATEDQQLESNDILFAWRTAEI